MKKTTTYIQKDTLDSYNPDIIFVEMAVFGLLLAIAKQTVSIGQYFYFERSVGKLNKIENVLAAASTISTLCSNPLYRPKRF